MHSLSSNIDSLATYQEQNFSVDYHPHSNNIVRDLVHPGLYSYVKDVTPIRASVDDVEPCVLLPHQHSSGDGNESDDAAHNWSGADFWGRPYENSKYQWLPTYFDISPEGKCTIEDYINNLTPRNEPVNSQLHDSLAQLFEHALPYIDSVYSYVRSIRPFVRHSFHDRPEWAEALKEMKMDSYTLKGNKLQVS